MDEAADTPVLEAPEVDESSPEEETATPPEAERHKELWDTVALYPVNYLLLLAPPTQLLGVIF